MMRGELGYKRDSNRLVIPEAYIIEQLNDTTIEIKEPPELRMPKAENEEERAPREEHNCVIVIDL